MVDLPVTRSAIKPVAGDGWSSDKKADQVDEAALIHPTLIHFPSPLFSGLFLCLKNAAAPIHSRVD